MNNEERIITYTLPIHKRKYEAWIRRLQLHYQCTMGVFKGMTCNCISDDNEPFVKFWTCRYVVHGTWRSLFE